jgi:hypothetical protein
LLQGFGNLLVGDPFPVSSLAFAHGGRGGHDRLTLGAGDI